MRNFRMIKTISMKEIPVLDGVQFKNGQVVVSWLSWHDSLSIYPSFIEFKKIHVEGQASKKFEIIWREDDETIT